MSRKVDPPPLTTSECERQAAALAGGTVLANLRGDKGLIAWAKVAGLYVRIDRRTKWGNPYEIGPDGDRGQVIESFRLYLIGRPELTQALPELRGKVLACWCHPEPCHGGVLIELAGETTTRVE